MPAASSQYYTRTAQILHWDGNHFHRRMGYWLL